VSDIDTAVVDSLKVLDPKRPIREADLNGGRWIVLVPQHQPTIDAIAIVIVTVMMLARTQSKRRLVGWALFTCSRSVT